MIATVHHHNGKSRSAQGRQPTREQATNVGDAERWVSVIGGGLLGLLGLKQGSLTGLGLAAIGGGLIYRGLTGHCNVYAALGVSTAAHHHAPATSVEAGRGVKVEKVVTINRSPEDLFRFWRDLENLPRFMSHLESVTTTGPTRSRWVAKGPLGMRVEWEAEIIQEKPNELIAWRSLEGARVDNAGSVHFRRVADDRGTEVRVVLKYDPPAGKLGVAVAKLLGDNPDSQIREDLRRFKQLMEAGETPTTWGQPTGRRF